MIFILVYWCDMGENRQSVFSPLSEKQLFSFSVCFIIDKTLVECRSDRVFELKFLSYKMNEDEKTYILDTWGESFIILNSISFYL